MSARTGASPRSMRRWFNEGKFFGTTPPPAYTFLNIVQLAWPGMMVEVDVTAMVPLK
jgi:hypothetical protein